VAAHKEPARHIARYRFFVLEQYLATNLSFLTPPIALPMVRPPSKRVWLGGTMTPQEPDRLHALGQKLDATQKRHAEAAKRPPPGQLGIAGRFATELVAALVVGAGLGWGIDWLFGHFGHRTQPLFLVVFFVLGAGAGILNVKRAADEINAQVAAERNKEKQIP